MPVLTVGINGHNYGLPRYGTIDLKNLPPQCNWALSMKIGDKIPIVGAEDIDNAMAAFFNH